MQTIGDHGIATIRQPNQRHRLACRADPPRCLAGVDEVLVEVLPADEDRAVARRCSPPADSDGEPQHIVVALTDGDSQRRPIVLARSYPALTSASREGAEI